MSANSITPWNILESKKGPDLKLFSSRFDSVENPRNGMRMEAVVIESQDWVNVVALTPGKKIILVKQYRFGTGKVSLEVPAGIVDPGETPVETARRELLEETGFTVSNIRLIGECYPQPAVLSNRCFFYLAEDAVKTRQQKLDAGEDIEILTVPLKEIQAKIESNEIDHGMVLLAFFFFRIKKGL